MHNYKQIVYRAKNKNNEWVYGQIFNVHPFSEEAQMYIFDREENGAISREEIVLVKTRDLCLMAESTDFFGKNIFTNDYIKYENKIYVVQYYKDAFIARQVIPKIKDSTYNYLLLGEMQMFEKIGNVYDNPNLINES